METREFEAFVVARTGSLLRFGRLVASDPHAAEDLVQGALAAAFRARRRLDAGGVEAYVRRSIVNAQASRWRRLLRREDVMRDPPDRGVRDTADAVDDRLWAVAVLRSLPPRQRAVLVLRYVYDLDEAAIARELEVSTGTVKSQAAKAMATLRAGARDADGELAR